MLTSTQIRNLRVYGLRKKIKKRKKQRKKERKKSENERKVVASAGVSVTNGFSLPLLSCFCSYADETSFALNLPRYKMTPSLLKERRELSPKKAKTL